MHAGSWNPVNRVQTILRTSIFTYRVDIVEDGISSLFLRKEDADKLWRCERRKMVSMKISRILKH